MRILRFGLGALMVSSLFIRCANKEIPTGPNCNETPLEVPSATVIDASSCTASDGQITVTALGGVAPFQFSFNNGAFQDSPTFTGLTAGLYPVTVRDSRGCTVEVDFSVNAAGSTLSAATSVSTNTQCFPPFTGSIDVQPTGGVPPYQIKFGDGSFGSTVFFDGLDDGDYTVLVKDAEDCTVTLVVSVPGGDTGISFSADIQSIINSRCAVPGCHVSGTSVPNFTSYSGVAARAQNIKLRTASGSMPPAGSPDLTAEEIQLIACWVDGGAKNN